MYFENGYEQIKIYSSVATDVTEALSKEAHKRGMTTTGHVPKSIGNARLAIEAGMDQLSHRSLILTVLFPDKNQSNLGRYYIEENEITQAQIDNAIDFLLKHKTVLDPTIALDVVRTLPRGSITENVEPEAFRIAYELFEGKRFRSGLPPQISKKAKADYTKAMGILGQFYKAGVPK